MKLGSSSSGELLFLMPCIGKKLPVTGSVGVAEFRRESCWTAGQSDSRTDGRPEKTLVDISDL
jgi:hypothetical protein